MYNIFHIEGGVGKHLMATCVLRNICNSFSENKTIVVTPYPEVFLHNPKIYRLFRGGNCPYFYDDYIKNKNVKIFKFDPYNSSEYFLKKEHLTESWCKTFGIKYDHRGPELYFSVMEDADLINLKQKFSPNKPIIIVQTNGGPGYSENHVNFHWFRDIPSNYFQAIINAFKDNFTFVHFKFPHQQNLENVTTVNFQLRESLNFLRIASGAICIDSMVQHAMAALGKKSLVCWIGNNPKVFGYKMHENIMSKFNFEQENPEGYLELYSITSEGYQCPSNYNPDNLFNTDELIEKFKNIFIK